MNTEEATEFLKDRGILTMKYPHGYLLKVSRREGSPSRRIEMDELDTILALGKVKLNAVEDNVTMWEMFSSKLKRRTLSETNAKHQR